LPEVYKNTVIVVILVIGVNVFIISLLMEKNRPTPTLDVVSTFWPLDVMC
jgi:hypothetical protein